MTAEKVAAQWKVERPEMEQFALASHQKAAKAHAEAKALMPGGVNSPVRAFGSVGGQPLFIDRASGCRVTDADGASFTTIWQNGGTISDGRIEIQGDQRERAMALLRELGYPAKQSGG